MTVWHLVALVSGFASAYILITPAAGASPRKLDPVRQRVADEVAGKLRRGLTAAPGSGVWAASGRAGDAFAKGLSAVDVARVALLPS